MRIYARSIFTVANSNMRRFNSITCLEVEGDVVEDPDDISANIVQFYTSLYVEPFHWRPSLDEFEFDSVSKGEMVWFERPFKEDEVARVVHDLNGDKAPCPDGFTFPFY